MYVSQSGFGGGGVRCSVCALVGVCVFLGDRGVGSGCGGFGMVCRSAFFRRSSYWAVGKMT